MQLAGGRPAWRRPGHTGLASSKGGKKTGGPQVQMAESPNACLARRKTCTARSGSRAISGHASCSLLYALVNGPRRIRRAWNDIMRKNDHPVRIGIRVMTTCLIKRCLVGERSDWPFLKHQMNKGHITRRRKKDTRWITGIGKWQLEVSIVAQVNKSVHVWRRLQNNETGTTVKSKAKKTELVTVSESCKSIFWLHGKREH